jgi:hypothetical protein
VKSKLPRILARRRFERSDQEAFAELSGDSNPLHMDAVEARRTIMGVPVVHGMHVVFRAIEAVLHTFGGHARGMRPKSVNARFPRPVFVGDIVEFQIVESDGGRRRIEGYVQQDLVLHLDLNFSRSDVRDTASVPKLKAMPLRELSFQELDGQSGTLPVGIDPAFAREQFRGLVADLGLPVFVELVALTRLVGMRCPGRHSLFSQFEVTFDGEEEKLGHMNFRVDRTDARFLRADIIVEGARLGGKLRVFFRPPPQVQLPIATISQSVTQNEFRSSVALIVGGSRGLGEATAKIIAAGGGRTIITFHLGKKDAAAVVSEIRKWGGQCDCVELDVLKSDALIKRLFTGKQSPRTIYYFATPQIFARRRQFFSPALFQKFMDYYVYAFTTLIDAAGARSATKLRVFYPSTVAVTEDLREVAEYAMAKRAAEDVCAFYNRYSDGIDIVVERLPRIKTDQTAVLFEVPARESVSVMLPIVRQVELGPSHHAQE